jgi:hypothetical protein
LEGKGEKEIFNRSTLSFRVKKGLNKPPGPLHRKLV